MSELKTIDKEYIANTYARFPVELVCGKGSLVYDETGREYIDMGSGIGVTAFGIADDEWKAAVTEQLGKLQHMSNLYFTEPCAMLAKLLCEKTGMKKVFFCNSGAEANFQPLTPGFVHAPANDLEAVKNAALQNKAAAVLIECIQGEGGVIPLQKDFVTGLADFCKEEDILLMVDEVQTGNGRTGELYAYMNFGVQPDVISTAKGLGGGLPLGAVLFGEKTEFTLGAGDHGSTFGGNPVCCAGALSILKRIDENLLADVKKKSAMLFAALQGAPGVESVSGMGLMIGIKTVKPASDVVKACMENGVLCLTAKDKVRLLPALNIPEDILMKAVDVIKGACA